MELDTTGSGSVSYSDFAAVMTGYHGDKLSAENANILTKVAELEGGRIDYKEYLVAI